MGIIDVFSTDIAIDLGTANTLIYVKGKGIVLNEPSIVAFDRSTKRIIALGNKAKEMQGREHKEIKVTRPMRDGVIADFEIAEGMIRAFIKRMKAGALSSRRVVVAVPSGVTEVEKRAVRDSAEHAGAKEVHLVAEPMAAAIGIGIDVHPPVGNMIIDIGGGTTEIAVIALSGIVNEESIRIAGDEMNYAIMQFFKRNHNILIGERTAEAIKCEVGSAVPLKEEITIQVKGRDLVGGSPKTTEVSSVEIREALNESITQIVNTVRQTLERTPKKVWAMLKEMGDLLESSRPNPAHQALAKLEEVGRLRSVITQNIDHLHQAAGNKRVIEYHGSHKNLVCMSCGRRHRKEELKLEFLPPLCDCSGVLKPTVVFFGEPIPWGAHLQLRRKPGIVKSCW